MVAVASAVIPVPAQSLSVTSFITSYAEGRYDEALRQAAAVRDLGPVRLQFVRDVQTWIASDPSRAAARRAAAAAFLLELTHARLETDWGRLSDLVEFTCAGLRAAGPPSPFELAWHRASMALAGRARERLWLLGVFATLPHQPPRKVPPSSKPDPNPQHLVHALERFPGDPQLRLAQVLAWTWGRDQEPARNVRRRQSGFLNESGPPQRQAIVALQPLVDDPLVGPEALVRIAHVHLTMGDHAAALAALEAAQRREAAPPIRYLSFFSAGRVLEALGRPEEAMAQYANALDVIPNAESATVALGSLEFVHDDRETAVSHLARVFDQSVSTPDPGRLTGYGSFMHWPRLREELRAELTR